MKKQRKLAAAHLLYSSLPPRRFQYDVSGENVFFLNVQNNEGCAGTFGQDCSDICQVEILVDQANPPVRIDVRQGADDPAHHVDVRMEPGVIAETIWVAGKTMRVDLNRVTTTGSLTVRGQEGNVQATDCVFASADLRATSGDLYFIETKNMRRDLKLEYRSAQGDFCMAQRGDTRVEEAPVWSGNAGAAWTDCDIRVAPWWQGKTLGHYDANNDGFVEQTEFMDGIAALPKCCGGNCPYRSWCAKYGVLMYPVVTQENATSNDFSGRTGILTGSVFLSRLVALEDYTLVPSCMRIIYSRDTATTPSTTVWVRLITDRGGIYVHRELDSTNEKDDSNTLVTGTKLVERNGTEVTVDPEGYSFYFPDDRTPGLKISSPAADALLGEVRDVYGPRDAGEDVFVTIDVAGTPGVAPSRWVYTTRPIFLYLQPALIEFLSGGLLNPPLKHYLITLRNDTCAYPLVTPDAQAPRRWTSMVPVDHEATARALFTALVPRFQLQMRGLLVQVGPKHQPRPEKVDLTLWTRDPSGNLLASPLRTSNDGNTEAAVWLSLVMAVLLAFMGTLGLVVYLRAILKASYQQAIIRRKLLQLKAEALEAKADAAIADAMAAKHGDGDPAAAAIDDSKAAPPAPDSKMVPELDTASASTSPLKSAPGTSSKAPLVKAEEAQEAADALDAKAAAAAEDAGELDAGAENPSFNPFETPLEIINLLFIVPVKRALLNSTSKFVNERCVVHIAMPGSDDEEAVATARDKVTGLVAPADGAGKATEMDKDEGVSSSARMGGLLVRDRNGRLVQAGLLPSVMKDEFMERYSQYCYLNDLAEHSNFDSIRASLINDFNLRVRSTPEQTLRGIRWKGGAAPTDFDVDADTMALVAAGLLARAKDAREALESSRFSELTDEVAGEDSVQDVAQGGRAALAAVFSPTGKAKSTTSVPVSKAETAAAAAAVAEVEEEPTVEWDDDDAFLLDSFLKAYCDVTRSYTRDGIYFVDTSIVREAEDGTRFRETVPGFYSAFAKYCEQVHRMEPATKSESIALLSQLYGVQHEKKRVTKVLGLSFIDFSAPDTSGQHKARLTASWYGMEALTVFIHLLVLLIPPILVMVYAMDMQYTHGQTMAGTEERPLSVYDFSSFPPRLEGRSIVFIVRLVLLFVATYVGLTLLRLLIRYMALPPGIFRLAVRKAYAAVLILTLFSVLTWLGLVLTWFVLAAALDPIRFLPYAGGAIAAVAVVVVTWGKLQKAAVILRKRMKQAFKDHLNKVVSAAKKALEQTEKLERQKEVGHLKKRRTTAAGAATAGAAGAGEEKEETFDVEDVFSLINADGDSVISKDEFDSLFDKLQLNVSQQKRSQMYAYCDRDGSGFIDQAEFVESWKYLEDVIVQVR